MPTAILNLDALRHNADQTLRCARRWGVDVLPVLKGIADHPDALHELSLAGFSRFGYTECMEAMRQTAGPVGTYTRDSRTLIQICPLSQAGEVSRLFARSVHSGPESLLALSGIAGTATSRNAPHSVLLAVDLGERREGVALADLPELLDYARSLPRLSVDGFAFTLGCSGKTFPSAKIIGKAQAVRDLFRSRGREKIVVSAGGSVFCAWLETHGPGPITEVRLGANFILGMDTYHDRPLPGGSFRSDVCLLQSEVLEVTERIFRKDPPGIPPFLDGYPVIPTRVSGKRVCALLDVGRAHLKLEGIACPLPGATISGISSNYLVLDVTDCLERPRVGQRLLFRLCYWSISKSFHSFLAPVRAVRDHWPDLAGIRHGETP